MIVRQYAPCSLGRSIICLGKQGEINALRVEFDVSAWMAMYPDATVKLMHFAPDRPQDNPVIPTLGVEGTLRVWIVGEEDTAGAGNGVIELLLIDERTGSTIKSATGYTTVLRSPSAGIEAQEAEAGYVRYDVDQSALLTDEQKAVARKNIGAGTGDGTGSGGILKETDPTVPDWAKQPSKPTYTAGEVGALPSSYTPPVTSVNGKTGEVALSAQDVRARPDTWTPSASDVGADAAGTASGAVAAHNTSGAAHADLRALIEGLTSRLNALADSDDTTLDQLSEIVAYIKSNKTLIDAVTTGKVSTSDIVDNLTTNSAGKVLSAAQGVALKAMIDGIVIPTALPNPQPITINGQRYDGSEAVTVTVSSEGGGTPVEIDDTLTQSGKAADAKAVGDRLSALNEANEAQDSDLDERFKNIGLYGCSPNVVDLSKITSGKFIRLDGLEGINSSYCYTDYIPVSEGDIITSWKWSGTRWTDTNQTIRYITAYDNNRNVIPSSGVETQLSYTIPSGVSYIVISVTESNLTNKKHMILKNYTSTPTEYIEYVSAEYKGKASFISHDMEEKISDISIENLQNLRRCKGGFVASGNLSEDVVFPNNSVNASYRIVVNAKITTLGTIRIGRKTNSTSYGYFEIDATEIRWFSTETTLIKTYEHGLTIGSECTIIIETNKNPANGYRRYEHKLTLISGGVAYTTDNIVINNFSKGKTCYIHADNSSVSVIASMTFYNANKAVYVFGDSYLTWSDARWVYYLYNDGLADNILTDAYSGRGSADALESFKNLESVGNPSYILWFMGMNDPDSADAVNSAWKTAYDYVSDYCDKNHIELILATIPEVSNSAYRNDKKNAIVRTSGRRYVDFAKAVNAETVGASWYDGMLSEDGVHPTTKGAMTLYDRILVDFQEIMIG